MSHEKPIEEKEMPGPAGEVSQKRREAMKKLGRYALYTAPAMLALFETERAAAGS